MTIKSRNRITLGFLIISSIIFATELGFFLIQIFKDSFQLPDFSIEINSATNFLFKYNSVYVILGILCQNIYVFFTTFFILRAFEKTQTTEIFYFSMFLLAFLCDSLRILIPLFHVTNTFSRLHFIIGNITLFSRILIPLSLMSTILLNDEDQRQNVERNSLILIIVAAFLAEIIPLNTSRINPNLLISFGYARTIRISTFIIHIVNIFTLFLRNKSRDSNQLTTIGYIMLTTGNYLLFDCLNIFNLVVGFLLLGSGTFLFLKTLHKYFLWND